MVRTGWRKIWYVVACGMGNGAIFPRETGERLAPDG